MVYIYVLQLEKSKWYVGKTTNPEHRIDSHFTSNGSTWTKLYRPIRLHHLIPDCDDYDEDKYTKIYMDKYGIDNVRGGSYVQVNLDDTTVDSLNRLSRGTNDKCFKCGKSGHFVNDCIDNNISTNNSEADNFNTIEKINSEVRRLKEELKIYNKHKGVIDWLNNYEPQNFRPNAKLKFEINKQNIIDSSIIDEFDNYKTCMINTRNISKKNNVMNLRIVEDIFYNFQTTMIKVDQLISEVYTEFILDTLCIDDRNQMEEELNDNTEYMFDENATETQIESSINNMKIYYLEVVNFVKQKEQIISRYPDDFEQLTQQKIIELSKKKINLV